MNPLNVAENVLDSGLLPLAWPWDLTAIPENQRWLVEHLWRDQGVGIIGGEPKCCKSFMALDIAISVASGSPCLRKFKVTSTGHVLFFAAEDALHIVRSRIEGICAAANIDLNTLKLQLITSHSLRLDLIDDASRIEKTVATLRPKLLILDPFVRLHRIDENNSGEVAPILANLRRLQRTYGVAIILVHHAKKGGNSTRAGQALRGSSEFHAWGDCNLYLRRDNKDYLNLSIEHRAEASISGLPLKLQSQNNALALQLDVERNHDGLPDFLEARPAETNLDQTFDPKIYIAPKGRQTTANKIVDILSKSKDPLSLRLVRSACGVRAETVVESLHALIKDGRVQQTDAGYAIS